MYRGTLNGLPVCVKRLRVATPEDIAVSYQHRHSPCAYSLMNQKLFCKEAVMWKSLKHPNILPLLGATISPSQLISVLMPAGDLSKYLPKNPDTNRIGLVGVDLVVLSVIAFSHQQLAFRDRRGPPLPALPKCDPRRSQGRKLLFRISTHCNTHTHQMNILVDVVDNIPHARITDFGIAIVTMNLNSIRPPTRQEAHTPRWSAPEILREQNPTKESDIYSFSMVTIEVYHERSELRAASDNCCRTNTGTHW